jgi:hypothetical protein
MSLMFDRPHQRFTPAEPAGKPTATRPDGKLTAALQALWDAAPPAREDEPW